MSSHSQQNTFSLAVKSFKRVKLQDDWHDKELDIPIFPEIAKNC